MYAKCRLQTRKSSSSNVVSSNDGGVKYALDLKRNYECC